jgi:hypothetical protein
MRTPQEIERGEEGPADDAVYINFSFKQIRSAFKWFFSLFFLVGVAHAQTSYCGVDVAKDFVPYGGVAKQTLSNLSLRSEQLDNAAWTKTAITVTADSVVAPDGALTAELLTLTAVGGTAARYIYATAVVAVGNMNVRRESIYLKAGTHNFVHWYSQYPSTAFVDVDLSTGTILRVGSTNLTSTVRSVGNGWYWVSFTHTPTNNNALPTIQPLKDAVSLTGATWTSTTAMTLYAWGASINEATSPADYLATTTAATTLGPLCPVGYTQSLTDPSRCFIVGPVAQRTIRTW